MTKPFQIQRVQNDASEFAAFERENEQFKNKGGAYDLPQDHVFKAGSLTLRVVPDVNQACNCCAFHDPELENGFDEDVNYCGEALCRDFQRADGVSVIFITDEDLLKLKMRGEL